MVPTDERPPMINPREGSGKLPDGTPYIGFWLLHAVDERQASTTMARALYVRCSGCFQDGGRPGRVGQRTEEHFIHGETHNSTIWISPFTAQLARTIRDTREECALHRAKVPSAQQRKNGIKRLLTLDTFVSLHSCSRAVMTTYLDSM